MALTLPQIRPFAAIRDDEENKKPYTVPVLLSKDHKKILKKKQVPVAVFSCVVACAIV